MSSNLCFCKAVDCCCSFCFPASTSLQSLQACLPSKVFTSASPRVADGGEALGHLLWRGPQVRRQALGCLGLVGVRIDDPQHIGVHAGVATGNKEE